MAVTNDALSEQIKGLDEKVDDFIGVQRRCNEGHEGRLRAVETELPLVGERVSQLRNIFGGIQVAIGTVLVWLGSR